MCLHTSDIQHDYRVLKEKGVQFLSEPQLLPGTKVTIVCFRRILTVLTSNCWKATSSRRLLGDFTPGIVRHHRELTGRERTQTLERSSSSSKPLLVHDHSGINMSPVPTSRSSSRPPVTTPTGFFDYFDLRSPPQEARDTRRRGTVGNVAVFVEAASCSGSRPMGHREEGSFVSLPRIPSTRSSNVQQTVARSAGPRLPLAASRKSSRR